jgi:signal transduction histidine kinase/DNA-binding response OmpR family regulator
MPSIVKVSKSGRLPVHYTLRFKFAVAVTILLATLLIINAGLSINNRISEFNTQLDQSATSFAQLTTEALVGAYQRYSAQEAFKFREEVASFIRKDPKVDQIMLLDTEGRILFDSGNPRLDENFKTPQGTGAMVPLETLAALRRLELTQNRITDRDGEKAIEVINPYFDSTGKSSYILRYVFSLRLLRERIYRSILQTSGLTLLSILFSIGLSMLFARRITQPLNELTLGASSIAMGDFDQKLDIRTNDELQDLARNFNYMAEQLKINITELEESRAQLQESNIRLEQSNVRLAQSNTRLEQTNLQLEQANEELKELDRMKSEFLQTISHELRTPLSAIKGYNEHLLEQMTGEIKPSQERALKIIQRNIDRLTTYINALLDFSRMESGAIPITIQPFNLKALIDQTVLAYKGQIEKKELELSTEVEKALPFVAGDRDRIAQVLDNLVSNAIKFTQEEGKIKISAQRVSKNGQKLVEVSVADTGVGIDEKHISKIFDRFYQADSSTTRRHGGIGIGLSFVKKIIDAHKSSIEVESKIHEGANFTFYLEEAEQIKLIELDHKFSVIENKKSYLIELIDDEPDINEIVKISLIKEGYNVIDATTGEEGLQIAREHHPDLIILDVRLPDASGYDVLAHLKQDPDTRAIPVMIMSVLKETEKEIAGGAIDHLTKPVDFKQLKAKINKYLQQDSRAIGGRPTVMIIDDEPDIVQYLSNRLTLEGFNTLIANNGSLALEMIKGEQARPKVILLDVIMPEPSGWDVITALKSDPTTAEIPVILFSAKGGEENIKRGYELGARDYIVKPFEIKDLLVEIKSIVREQNQGDLSWSGSN